MSPSLEELQARLMRESLQDWTKERLKQCLPLYRNLVNSPALDLWARQVDMRMRVLAAAMSAEGATPSEREYAAGRFNEAMNMIEFPKIVLAVLENTLKDEEDTDG